MRRLIFGLVLLVSILSSKATSSNSTGCSGEFKHRCHCGQSHYEGKQRYVTNCTRANLTVEVLQQLPPETEILIFTGNNIPMLPQNTFGVDTTYQKLEVIDLSGNNIRHIMGQSFHHISSVKKLVLNDNKWIVEDHARLFANLQKLEELHLNRAIDVTYNESVYLLMSFFEDNPLPNLKVLNLAHNGIGPTLETDVFCHVPSLQVLNLADNRISDVHWNNTCFKSLLTADLQRNLIKYFSNFTLDAFDALPTLRLYLEGNDYDCDCNIIDFQHWLHVTHVDVPNREHFICKDGFPESNFRQLVMEIPQSELQCIEHLALHKSFGFVNIILIIILIVLGSLLTGVLILNRKTIVKAVQQTFQPISRRMQYSTIQKEAEQEVEV